MAYGGLPKREIINSMRLRDKEFTPGQLQALLISDAIKRNETLNSFLRLLNSVQANAYLSIDGEWGSGKTVFVRQLELLSHIDLAQPENQKIVNLGHIDQSSVEVFQKKYMTYYYNAWQNDYHEDPIQSLLFNLINDYQVKDGLKDKAKKVSQQVVKDSIVSGVKTLSQGFINLEGIDNASSLRGLAGDITTASERKAAVSNIINTLLPKDTKLLFIVDELDRCSPLFAVRMLEAIKHYYDNDNVVFVISTNDTQLAHTVKKHYGNGFNGSGYLNKFYDFVFNLPEVDTSAYISEHIGRQADSYWHNITPRHIATNLNMNMREITRYYASLDIISDYLTSVSSYGEIKHDITQYLFVPLALALKVSDVDKYSAFKSGSGDEIIKEVCRSDETLLRIASEYMPVTQKEEPEYQLDTIIATYHELFTHTQNTGNFHDTEEHKVLQKVIALINAAGTIDDAETNT